MDYLFIIKVTVYIALFVLVICCQINGYSNLQREKEIFKRGQLVQGKVERINCVIINRSFARQYNCTLVVSFSWEHSNYRLRTLTTVPHRKYTKGSNVDLLFLPEYHKKVIIKDAKAPSLLGFWADTLFIFLMTTAAVIALINLWS